MADFGRHEVQHRGQFGCRDVVPVRVCAYWLGELSCWVICSDPDRLQTTYSVAESEESAAFISFPNPHEVGLVAKDSSTTAYMVETKSVAPANFRAKYSLWFQLRTRM